MANLSRYGFRLVQHPGGGGKAQPISMPVASNWTGVCNSINVDMCVGDLVSIRSTGYVDFRSSSSTYTAANQYYGVVVGIEQYWDATNNVMQKGLGNRIPQATVYGTNYERESRVLVQPFAAGQIWEAEFATATTYTTYATYLATQGSNVELLFTGADSSLKKSFLRLDDTSVATTNTLPFRILSIPKETDSGPQDFTAAYVKAWVTPNYIQNAPFYTTGI